MSYRRRKTSNGDLIVTMRAHRRPIAPARDRAQSRALVIIAGTLLAAGLANLTRLALQISQSGSSFWIAVGVSLTFGVVVCVLRAATPAAAALGSAICLLLAVYPFRPEHSLTHSLLVSLLALFILTFAATRFGRERKQALGLAEPTHGRNAAQVIANLGFAGLLAACSPAPTTFATVLILAALGEATADTLSSEIGQAFGGTPWLITRMQQVAPGTDGAISPLGTLVGVTGAACVVEIGALALGRNQATALIALIAAAGGLFFDSLLGGTVERRGWLNNDLVNFASTVFAAACAAVFFTL